MLVRFMTVVYGVAIVIIFAAIIGTLAGCKAYPEREPCAPAGCQVPHPTASS